MAIYKELVKKVSVPSDKKIKQKEYLDKGLLPIIDQGHLLIGGYTDDFTKALACDYPVIVFGDHTKCVKFITFPFAPGADGIKVLQPKKEILPKYLYYGTQYLTFRIEDKGYARHYQHLEKKELIVPPLPEQERIVARIEELFPELDKVVETLKTTKQQLTVYRQAVLKEAFEPLNNAVDMEKIATMLDPHPSHRTPPEVEGGIPYIGIGDIDYDAKIINFNIARKVSAQIAKEHFERYTLQKGDFVMGKIGTIGKPFKLPLPQNYTLSANVILIQPNSEFVLPEFLFWQFTSPYITQQLMKGATATSQPAFGIKKARKLQIKICDIMMQNKILENIQAKMSICDSIEKTVDTALQQAEAMRQSILKQAFEGGI